MTFFHFDHEEGASLDTVNRVWMTVIQAEVGEKA